MGNNQKQCTRRNLLNLTPDHFTHFKDLTKSQIEEPLPEDFHKDSLLVVVLETNVIVLLLLALDVLRVSTVYR